MGKPEKDTRDRKDTNQTSRDEKYKVWDVEQIRYYEDKTDELEDTVKETTDNERERKKTNKDTQGRAVLVNIFKRSNPHATGVRERRSRGKERKDNLNK